jgi:hypothetical protein
LPDPDDPDAPVDDPRAPDDDPVVDVPTNDPPVER